MNNFHYCYSLRTILITKKYFTRKGYNFFDISEMNITFITRFNNMTYK